MASQRRLNGSDLRSMFEAGAELVREAAERINALNVFPVPDGDTGTNMNMTMASGVQSLRSASPARIDEAADRLAKGLLMGARGNSGVILSQLFRGFAKGAANQAELDGRQFAAALQQGVETAYQAVVKPVEGTVLTVAREAAAQAAAAARRTKDPAEVMQEALRAAETALARTPEQLPVLKQVGVVDAGGQGLVLLYQGFLQALGEQPAGTVPVLAYGTIEVGTPAPAENGSLHGMAAQAHFHTGDIANGYCTEFILSLPEQSGPDKAPFDESAFRRELAEMGDSLLVAAHERLVKVHVHANRPGEVLNTAMRYGELATIKIENMREQHHRIVESEGGLASGAAAARKAAPESAESQSPPIVSHSAMPPPPPPHSQARTGSAAVIAVAAGDGLAEIFRSLGVSRVISGGQTMNPSTEDILNAAQSLEAETIFLLPNNSNIVLAAKQAAELSGNKLNVIPTVTIAQGLAAAIAFRADASEAANLQAMNEAFAHVRSGALTRAVRDTRLDGLDIHRDDYIGLIDQKIVTAGPDLTGTVCNLAERMLAQAGADAELLTVILGEDASEDATATLTAYLQEKYPELEIETCHGGQPLYPYLFALE